jgi:hypothetical protein
MFNWLHLPLRQLVRCAAVMWHGLRTPTDSSNGLLVSICRRLSGTVFPRIVKAQVR